MEVTNLIGFMQNDSQTHFLIICGGLWSNAYMIQQSSGVAEKYLSFTIYHLLFSVSIVEGDPFWVAE